MEYMGESVFGDRSSGSHRKREGVVETTNFFSNRQLFLSNPDTTSPPPYHHYSTNVVIAHRQYCVDPAGVAEAHGELISRPK